MKKKLWSPPSFERFAAQMFNDAGLHFKTLEARINFGLNSLSLSEREKFLTFIEGYLAGDFTDREMEEIWSMTQADIRPKDARSMRELLTIAARLARAGRKRP